MTRYRYYIEGYTGTVESLDSLRSKMRQMVSSNPGLVGKTLQIAAGEAYKTTTLYSGNIKTIVVPPLGEWR